MSLTQRLSDLFTPALLAMTAGLNKFWISKPTRRSDQGAEMASRMMVLAVSAVALLTAAVGVGQPPSGRAQASLR
ncbi:MAG: hypothetical protein ACKO3M_07070 [Rubrivivax sp.]